MPERSDEERLIRAVAKELRKAVPLSPGFDARVAEGIQRSRRTASRRKLAWGMLGLAAALAAFAILRGSQPGANGVQFAIEAPGAARVNLVGDFNNWDPTATPLSRRSDGQWETIVSLEPGRYQFTFVVDGTQWMPAPGLPAASDDFGRPSSVITVVNPSPS
jgi:hypothetical protein